MFDATIFVNTILNHIDGKVYLVVTGVDSKWVHAGIHHTSDGLRGATTSIPLDWFQRQVEEGELIPST